MTKQGNAISELASESSAQVETHGVAGAPAEVTA
jgi:hypothetical protein